MKIAWLLGLALIAACNVDVYKNDPADPLDLAKPTRPPTAEELLQMGCATATAAPDRVPLYMHFVLDGSGSMRQNGKWSAAVPALSAIFEDLASREDPSLGAGLTVFADRRDLTISDNWAGPYNKMDVPVAYVNAAQLEKLKERLNTIPYLGTPTYEVLSGQYPLLRSLVPASPLLSGGRRVLVFITDGVPDEDMPAGKNEIPWSLRDAAQEATHPVEAIRTFVVGVGPFPPRPSVDYGPDFLGALAVAGGTRSSDSCEPTETMDATKLCYFQITPPDAGSPSQAEIDALKKGFIDAVGAVRARAVTCEYALKRINEERGNVDPANVNVFFQDGAGVQSLVPQNSATGWSYDNPQKPERVVLSGPACDRVKADPKGKVIVVLGCKTVLE